MICKYCKKPLPRIKAERCPHCFAAWEPYEPEMKEENVKVENEEGE